MRFDISTFTSTRNPHVEIDQSLPHPAIRRSVLLSGKCTRTNSYCWVQQTARKRENEIWHQHIHLYKKPTCRNWSVIATPSNKTECVVIGSVSHVQILIAGSSKLLEREKMRFDISTCTSRRNPHVEIDQSLPHPAIRRSVLLSGKCTRTNSYCWVQQTARKRENEIWHQHIHL